MDNDSIKPENVTRTLISMSAPNTEYLAKPRCPICSSPELASYEILEHKADISIQARTFQQCEGVTIR